MKQAEKYLVDNGGKLAHYFGGGVYVKEAVIPAGTLLSQHVHKYDHISILASGTAVVSVDGASETHTGPACLVISAGKEHKVESVTDVVWFCIHATNETDPDVIDEAVTA